MTLLVPHQTKLVVGGDHAPHVESRALYFDRYADPQLKDSGVQTPRRDFYTRGISKAPATPADFLSRHRAFLFNGLKLSPVDVIFARNEARLLLNMAGGVMENAGLCLDRFSCLPFIPGSAIKGCARRAALAALREWIVVNDGKKPPEAFVNPLATACAGFNTPEGMLAAIARVFGWSDTDWSDRNHKKSGTPQSDFRWACGVEKDDEPADAHAKWRELRDKAQTILGPESTRVPRAAAGVPPTAPDASGETPDTAGRRPAIPKQYAGSVAFLPAHPWSRPNGPDLELDVLTSHHGDYYRSEDPDKVAADTENPVPVFFPAVAPGHVFAFTTVWCGHSGAGADQVPDARAALLELARTWLRVGVTIFGLGAKTAAGYGWFEVEETTKKERAALDVENAKRVADAARASLVPNDAHLAMFAKMKPDQLRGAINAFSYLENLWANKDERYQLSLVHFVISFPPSFYSDEKQKGSKSKVMNALSALAKKFNRTLP